jgi:hypothetical protein
MGLVNQADAGAPRKAVHLNGCAVFIDCFHGYCGCCSKGNLGVSGDFGSLGRSGQAAAAAHTGQWGIARMRLHEFSG